MNAKEKYTSPEPTIVESLTQEEPSEKPTQSTNKFPDADHRPSYVNLKDWIKVDSKKIPPGVYFCGLKVRNEGPPECFETYVCSTLSVEAITFDPQGNNFGRLLRFKPTVGENRTWSMPMDLLAGDGAELRAELLAMGVELDPEAARKHLSTYIQRQHPKRQMRCVQQIGWCKDSFVLPDTVIGPNASDVIYQSGERGHEEHTQAGSLDEWRAEIAALAIGNPLLMFALSVAFAGPMLNRTNSEGGGFHFVGDSSTGKTTLIEAACSVWGGSTFKRSWRATANGMEGVAALFNDCLLALDEISQCDPREVGSIIYTLGNGRGKQRASRSGLARGITQWKCMVLSSGERSIETSMLDGGHKVKAGQSIRLLDIPVAQAFGAWDELHGCPTAAGFSDKIKRSATKYHGKVGRAFLEKLTFDQTDFCEIYERVKASGQFQTSGSDGQEKRAAGRFAIAAMSGELATSYGLTGWPTGAAAKACAGAYKLWQSTRGLGNDEPLKILKQVSDFIQRFGDARFSDFEGEDSFKINDRAGWWISNGGQREYRFNSSGLHEALSGFDFKRGVAVLVEAGAIPKPAANGEKARFFRVKGQGIKLYAVNPDKLTRVADDI